ncbi:type II secretion system protein [Pseudoduganella lurida]|uniref:type II secretion system protein n=1 Tax=Pseudoduganella lurida TaxID=1036180 RepID=UPI0018F3ED92|nr:type II secretion system protein [Pseudoduganella lurida]
MVGAGGFTYVGLIILVAIVALVAATTLRVGVTLQRAQAERDLLQIGEQFSNALKSYAAATPAGQPQQPNTLQDLLKDPRFPGTRRHLRKIFVDPMTGRAEWGVIYIAENKGVLGIHSLSAAPPIKISNFPQRFLSFDNRKKISDWVFTPDGREPRPPALVKPGQSTPSPAGPGGATLVPSPIAPAVPPKPAENAAPAEPPAPETPQEPEPAANPAHPDASESAGPVEQPVSATAE